MRPAVGVNLMPPSWVGRSPLVGAHLLERRRRLLDRMADVGLDHATVGDHVMFRDDGIGNDGLTDAASVATATDRLGVHLAVYLMVLRHPVPVARQILTLAQFAPGRLVLGVGIGGDDRAEVAACGIDPSTRGRRMDEALDVVRRLVRGETVTVDGEFVRLDGAHMAPTPPEPIPFVVGGRSEAALRRAGRLGDGWLGIWTSARRCAESVAAVEAHAAAAGRTDVRWRHGMTFWIGVGDDADDARSQVAPAMERVYKLPFDRFARHVPCGTPAEIAEQLAPYLDAGIGTVNAIPFARSEERAIDALAEVRVLLRGEHP
jgi:alkanesulfonate monooxygenase SsuD/methylene tetrahydromethanopterin reductase-like flavin-dependent oxidoreductase (luciferase family)